MAPRIGSKRASATSQYMGVFKDKSKDRRQDAPASSTRWISQFHAQGKLVHCGYFYSELDAALAYDARAKDFGRPLNFQDGRAPPAVEAPPRKLRAAAFEQAHFLAAAPPAFQQPFRPAEGAAFRPEVVAFDIGDTVLAHCLAQPAHFSQTNLFAGRIVAVKRYEQEWLSTYDVDFDHGVRECNVPPHAMQLLRRFSADAQFPPHASLMRQEPIRPDALMLHRQQHHAGMQQHLASLLRHNVESPGWPHRKMSPHREMLWLSEAGQPFTAPWSSVVANQRIDDRPAALPQPAFQQTDAPSEAPSALHALREAAVHRPRLASFEAPRVSACSSPHSATCNSRCKLQLRMDAPRLDVPRLDAARPTIRSPPRDAIDDDLCDPRGAAATALAGLADLAGLAEVAAKAPRSPERRAESPARSEGSSSSSRSSKTDRRSSKTDRRSSKTDRKRRREDVEMPRLVLEFQGRKTPELLRPKSPHTSPRRTPSSPLTMQPAQQLRACQTADGNARPIAPVDCAPHLAPPRIFPNSAFYANAAALGVRQQMFCHPTFSVPLDFAFAPQQHAFSQPPHDAHISHRLHCEAAASQWRNRAV
ncbi:hypothetical protein M885DRAFT_589093 [Pelagophyceae sp. CCMP2097]|nr:hypothetical protein M885DRAFT_589093 [Pelagophyceae sp. CCMP2097]